MYPAFLWPIGIRAFVLSQLSLEIQLERYAKDPSGVILAGALLTILFFIVPLIPFMFMNTYKLTESSQLIQTSLVFRRSRTIELSDIGNIEVTEGISGIVPTNLSSM